MAGPDSKFTPEIKSSMKGEPGDTPAELARDKARGVKQGSPQDVKEDAARMARLAPRGTPPPQVAHGGGGMPPDAHHVAAATSIAHAILNSR